MMRAKILLGAATVLSLAGGQAYAATGYAGAAFINADAEVAGFEGDDDGWGIEGAAAFVAHPGVGVQIGAVLADFSDTTFSIDGHLNFRNDRWLLGGFLGAGELSNDGFWTIGAEGEYYMPSITLAAALGFADADNGDSWAIDGEIRVFPIENLRLEGAVGFGNVDTDFGDDDLFTAGISGEFQFDAAPISIFINYEHDEFDEADISGDTLFVGARWNFGGTLRMRDLRGVSLPGLSRFTASLGG
jgi:hypothetical protein